MTSRPPAESGFRLVDGLDGDDHVGHDEADGEGEDEQVSEHICDVFRPEPVIGAGTLPRAGGGRLHRFCPVIFRDCCPRRLWSPGPVTAGLAAPFRRTLGLSGRHLAGRFLTDEVTFGLAAG